MRECVCVRERESVNERECVCVYIYIYIYIYIYMEHCIADHTLSTLCCEQGLCVVTLSGDIVYHRAYCSPVRS